MILISFIKTSKLLKKGCEGFIVFVATDSVGKVSVNEVLVVNQFLDVFLNDLSRFPPNREIEFTMDLMPSIVPISNAPY